MVQLEQIKHFHLCILGICLVRKIFRRKIAEKLEGGNFLRSQDLCKAKKQNDKLFQSNDLAFLVVHERIN